MTVAGDLSTIDLPDLLQNIESHGRTGTLRLTGEHGAAHVLFRDGHLMALAADWRKSLGERLVATGHLTERKLAGARKRQRAGRKSLGQVLTAARAMTADDLRAAAEHFLSEDVIDLISSAQGEFEFVEGPPPKGVFERDEATLGLAIAVAPLILEASRRVDQWTEIRRYVPNDAVHLRARDNAQVSPDCEDPEFATDVLEALDGALSVVEVAERFPDRRFECFELVAAFTRDHVTRALNADDLLAVAESVGKARPGRARVVARRGLRCEPQHEDLLAFEAELSEQLGDLTAAVEAHKLLAHILAENGSSDDALAELERARDLAPSDPAIVERTLTLRQELGHAQEAQQDGLRLVELYRAPGLHARAKDVLVRLQRADPESIELELELARTRVDCGEAPAAIQQLLRRGKRLVGAENYVGAHLLFEAVLEIEPSNREAAVSVEMIDKEEFARRRQRQRQLLRRCYTTLWLLALATVVWIEASARIAYVDLRSRIGTDRLLERGEHAEAARLWRSFCDEHSCSFTALLDVPTLLAELESAAGERLGDAPEDDSGAPNDDDGARVLRRAGDTTGGH